jgi:hypothetical protein
VIYLFQSTISTRDGIVHSITTDLMSELPKYATKHNRELKVQFVFVVPGSNFC